MKPYWDCIGKSTSGANDTNVEEKGGIKEGFEVCISGVVFISVSIDKQNDMVCPCQPNGNDI